MSELGKIRWGEGKNELKGAKKKTKISRKMDECVNKITQRIEEIESDVYEQEIL